MSSSVTIKSATLSDLLTFAFSETVVNSWETLSIEASFTSIIATDIFTLSSGVRPTVVSSTCTSTSSMASVSKSRTDPAFRNNSVPSSSNRTWSTPESTRLLLPRTSSMISISAIFMRALVSALSSKNEVTTTTLKDGESFTSTAPSSTTVTLTTSDTETVPSSTRKLIWAVPLKSPCGINDSVEKDAFKPGTVPM